jgi:hypothetical protein
MKLDDDIFSLVALACNNQADFDTTMELLDKKIAAQPHEPALYRLRAQLYAAACDRLSAWQDWVRINALVPHDRDAALEMACLQYQLAVQIADAEMHGVDDPNPMIDDGSRIADEWAGAAADSEARIAHLRQQAIALLCSLMRQHADDSVFALQLLVVWNRLPVWEPWVHYTLILTALTAHPHHRELRKQEADYLVTLANAVAEDDNKISSGYFADSLGSPCHALTVERALQAIDTLLNDGVEADLLSSKAALLTALQDYPGAADAYRQLAQAYDHLLTGAAQDAQAELIESRDRATTQAALCSAGRHAFIAAQFGDIDASMARFRDMQQALSERIAGDNDQWQLHNAEIDGAIAQWREATGDIATEPPEERRLLLIASARKIAQKTVALINQQSIELHAIDGEAQQVVLWFNQIAPQLEAAGLTLQAWFSHHATSPSMTEAACHQFWNDATHQFAFTAETVRQLRLRRLLSELSDGSLLVTADTRGTSYYASGPDIDTFQVFKDTSISDMIALHQARVALALAMTPGLHVRAVDSLSRLQEVENRMRVLKNRFRAEVGMTDAEIRGLHVDFHDYFSALLKNEMAMLIAALD